MRKETREAWGAICAQELNRRLDDCAPELVASDAVIEGLFPMLQEIGASTGENTSLCDEISVGIVERAFKSAIETDSFAAFKVLKPRERDLARDFARRVLMSISLMSERGMDYGPVPAGLRGRPLARAALALEILQARTPQRLRAQEQGSMH